jgi:putative heme-binding domain-containing protein
MPVPLLLAAAAVLLLAQAQEKDPYADKPYWYKPGHPLQPADAAAVQTPAGFAAERVLSVPAEMGSWTALAADPKGRLTAAAQHRPGLFRITPARIGDPASETKVERLRGAAEKVGWSHGLLHAFDSLYVTVTEEGGARRGVHRLRDGDGDDQYDAAELILPLQGGGEHGPHNLVVSPDGKTLTMIAGNGTQLPEGVARRRPVRSEGVDHLMPPGFDTTRHSTEGWVLRMDPDGRNRELLLSGLRNSFDLAYDRHGELFTFDSDMEWDQGTPWYRPTRICHLVSGGEYGWRKGTGIWPDYYPDSVQAVVNVGPSSPTGLCFGYGAKFPARWQRALFVCDWTFATIHAVHLTPDGSGYRAEFEEFAAGRGLPVTDVVVGGDGALYFVVGGRNLGSAVYRVRYVGAESTAPAEAVDAPGAAELRALRRSLEDFHGRKDPAAIDAAWPRLGHADRGIRFAARIAVEHQPVDSWKERAPGEPEALLALSRQGPPEDQPRVIEALASIDFAKASHVGKLTQLRTLELAFARGGTAARPLAARTAARLEPCFPDPDAYVSRELARLLCYLGDSKAVPRMVAMMEADAGQAETLGKSTYARNDKYGKSVADMLEAAPRVQRMHLAQMLIWTKEGWTDDLRERYFRLIAEGASHSKGGYWYRDFWERTRKNALDAVPAELRGSLEAIRAEERVVVDPAKLPRAKGPGRAWTTDGVLAELKDGLKGRDFENGRTMFAAASCLVCHRVREPGGTVGPRLLGLGGRFTLRDIVEAVVEPNKSVSDQYRMARILKKDGAVVEGRVSFLEAGTWHLMPDMLHPGRIVTVRPHEVEAVKAMETSPMPTRLLDPLSRDEVLDLMAYLLSEGDPEHAAFRR